MERTGGDDEYVRRHMQPGERLLHREKVVSRTAFRLSIGFALVFGAVGLAAILAGATALSGAAALGPLVGGAWFVVMAAAFAVLGAAFSVFRSMVTSGHVHVHFGWVRRRIPLDAIDSVSVVKLVGFRQGKVSLGLDGVVRTWVGESRSGRGLEIRYQDAARRHVLTIGSERPERFVEAIEAARGAEAGLEAVEGADAEGADAAEAQRRASV